MYRAIQPGHGFAAGLFVSMFFLMICGVSRAQTACPGGVAAGSAQCGPSPTNHLPAQPAQTQTTTRRVPTGQWRDSWGAVAVDSKVGSVGASVEMPSESSARADALRRCSKSGARDCELLQAFLNQCIALAWPKSMEGRVVSQTEMTVEKAGEKAISICVDAGGVKCDVVYSVCLEPVFEPY